MKEDFLYHLWKFQKFNSEAITTTEGQSIQVLHPGMQNDRSGPDFFNAKVRIGEQLWAGNVEMHLKSSDWYFHGHECDENYDNVILHVVWDHDAEVYRKNDTVIPTLALSGKIEVGLLEAYQQLLIKDHAKLNCENDFAGFPDLILHHWLERLFFERLEAKSSQIWKLLEATGNNWEVVLYHMLFRSFGLNVNSNAFLACAQSIDFKYVQKSRSHFYLEALFLGQSGLIKSEDKYALSLKKEYSFLKHKFGLANEFLERPQFFRLRPDNFPTIRLAQLAALYASRKNLFYDLVQSRNIHELRSLMDLNVSEYWRTHYNFGSSHQEKDKKLTSDFIDLILINCVVPLKYCYTKFLGNGEESSAQELISNITAEKNTVVRLFNDLRPNTARTAMDSQALLQLKKKYCNVNRCLECELGVTLMRKSPKYN